MRVNMRINMRIAMRVILPLVGAIVAAVGVIGERDAHAAPVYRYCANYEGRDVITCAYDTFQQCLDTAGGGAGGFCSENPAWQPGPVEPVRPRARRRTPH
jgi:Protein of unknown function (DUF3551)